MPSSMASRSLALDQRQVAQLGTVMLDQIEGIQAPPQAGVGSAARKSDIPSMLMITTSSIRNECASRPAAAATMEGKRSATVIGVAGESSAPAIRLGVPSIAVMLDFVDP